MFTMKYKLDINRLQPGDIILAGYNDKLSKCILMQCYIGMVQ